MFGSNTLNQFAPFVGEKADCKLLALLALP